MRSTRHAALLIVLATSAGIVAQPPQSSAGLAPLDFVIGQWRGTSEGQPGRGTVEREYLRILNARFIEVRNRSTYPPQERNTKGEVHEDRGVFSFDQARRRIVLRQFHVEGFVNQYASEPVAADGALVFMSEAIENIPAGYRARETYRRIGDDEMEEVFELAPPGKDFALYSRTRLKRVSR